MSTSSLANVRLLTSGPKFSCETWSSRRGGQTTARSPLDRVSSRTAGRSALRGPIPRACHALTAVGSVEGPAHGAKGAKPAISPTTVGVALTSRSARGASDASASHSGWYVPYRGDPRTLASRAGRGCQLERARRGAVRCSRTACCHGRRRRRRWCYNFRPNPPHAGQPGLSSTERPHHPIRRARALSRWVRW